MDRNRKSTKCDDSVNTISSLAKKFTIHYPAKRQERKRRKKTMQLNNVDFDTYLKNYPDANGYFGKYGGAYIPEELK